MARAPATRRGVEAPATDGMEAEERERRRDSFLGTAEDYFAARPAYPDALLRSAVRLGGLESGASVLEVGCGTGEVTRWLGSRGFSVLALDRSDAMLRYARRRVEGISGIEIRHQDFETQTPRERFDGLWAATSYHWLDPETRAARCAACLRPGGALVLLWHTHPTPYTGFFERVEPVYRRIVPEWEPPPSPGMSGRRLADIEEELDREGDFRSVERRAHDWTRDYPTALYLRLLRTYSDHRLLSDRQRAELFEEVASLIDREFGGSVTRPYRTELLVALREA